LLRVLAPDHQDLADGLDRLRRELAADRLHPRRARLAVVGGGLHLDEFVRREGAVDLGEDRVGEALVADPDDGVQGVGPGAQFAAAGGRKGRHAGIMTHIARHGR
jgi:hypothetical protein